MNVDLFIDNETPVETAKTPTLTLLEARKDVSTLIELQPMVQTGGGRNDQMKRLSQYGCQMYPLLSGIYGDVFNPFDPVIQDSQEGLVVKDFGGHDVEFDWVPHSYSVKSWVDKVFSWQHF
jgi:hypothetical protein